MTDKAFAGDKKVGASILSPIEKAFVAWGAPKIPKGIETYHLTLLTLVWSALNPLFGYLAISNLQWLWAVSGIIVLQYITDLFDGAVGRHRNTGLVKWGFYMDHFLDYVFLCSLVLTGYIIAPSGLGLYYLILLIILTGFMVSSFLNLAATNQFQIYYLGVGPTEIRIVFILINAIIIYTGTEHFIYSVPILCGVCLIGLVIHTYQIASKLWKIDMKRLNNIK